MDVLIGVVLHSGHRARFAEAAATLGGVTLAWATYDHEEEIRDRVATLLGSHRPDGVLLGLVPHARARDLLPADLPVMVTRPAALDLALAWARARRPLVPVSVDTFTDETVDEVAASLGLPADSIARLPFDPSQSTDDVVAFHRSYVEQNGAEYVISVRTAVSAALDGEVTVLNALATAGTIRADLHELALRIRSLRADRRRFAAGVFLADSPGGDSDRPRIGLLNLLVNAPEFADAWTGERGRRGVVVFAPASLFESVTHQWTGLPLLAEARERLGVRVAAGFGIGASARSCVALAEKAATFAERDPEPQAYLMTEEGVVLGPMGTSSSRLTYTYRDHGALDDLAARVGLSAATLSRLAALERSLGDRTLSPSDLARSLGITDPSGRRLMRKLIESHLAVSSGSAQPHPKGRPARLYRLAIAAALD
ncbi:transcriptional regulator [Actinoplanes sp. NPDC049265]|uniref:transcriptional regulator n=1 Tax=Actinoplanes sp. NPDC049265 TaxID=3363902 RepID=UPI003711E947